MNRWLGLLFALLLPFSARAGANDVTDADRRFLREIKAAIQTDNPTRLAALVQYPITVQAGKAPLTVNSPVEFAEHYRQIVTQAVKDAVRQQSADTLFKNWQGVMIGRGELWFAEIKPPGSGGFVLRIIAFNP